MSFCSLAKVITQKICWFCLVLINTVLLNLLCAWILHFFFFLFLFHCVAGVDLHITTDTKKPQRQTNMWRTKPCIRMSRFEQNFEWPCAVAFFCELLLVIFCCWCWSRCPKHCVAGADLYVPMTVLLVLICMCPSLCCWCWSACAHHCVAGADLHVPITVLLV